MTTLSIEQINKINHIENLKKQYKDYPIKWGWNGLGYLIYKRTYARDLWKVQRKQKWTDWIYTDELSDNEYKKHTKLLAMGKMLHRKEEFHETIARCLRSSIKLGVPYTIDDINRMFKYCLDLLCSFSGRFLWQADTKLLNQGINDSTLNCWYYNMDSFGNICKSFNQLMLGGGVGFSVEKEYIYKLPIITKANVKLDNSLSKKQIIKEYTELDVGIKINIDKGFRTTSLDSEYKENDSILYVGDSREGWVNLLGYIFEAYTDNQNRNIRFNTKLIRKKGSLIKGFGGKASGDKPLIKGIKQICKILDGAVGRQLNSVEVTDIMCIVASIVVSGNIRRSALLALSDIDDIDFITIKRRDLKTIPDYRQNVNISINCDDTKKLPTEFWDSFRVLGECIGLFNKKLSREFGRLGKNKIKDLNDYYYDLYNQNFKDIWKSYDNKSFEDFHFISPDSMRGLVKADPLVDGCNPCQPSFAEVLTPDGIRQFNDIDSGSIIWSQEKWVKVIKKWSNGVKPVYKYKTTAGSFIGTENHSIVQNKIKIEVDQAKKIDILAGVDYTHDFTHLPKFVMDGLVIGDGTKHLSSKDKVYLNIGNNDLDYFNSEVKDYILDNHPVKKNKCFKVDTTITHDELPHTYERDIPDRFFYGKHDEVCSFLRGLYSANGSVVSDRITLKQASFNIIERVQKMLSSVGIRSYYTTNKPQKISWHNGDYVSKQSYDLNISSDREIFYRKIGFIQQYKNVKLQKMLNKRKQSVLKSHTIIEKEYLGDFEVFDITVDGFFHTYWHNGLNVSNCGESTLPSGTNCNLATICLNKTESMEQRKDIAYLLYLNNKFISQGTFYYKDDQKNINDNARIGINGTEIVNDIDKSVEIGQELYEYLREIDKKVSKEYGFKESTKLTVTQPLGTLQFLLGTNAGIHYLYSPFFLRNVRFDASDPLVELCRKNNFRIEDQIVITKMSASGEILETTTNPDMKVIYFPCKAPENAVTEKDVSAIQQIEANIKWQEAFVDQSISQTVKYKPEELDEIIAYLDKHYKNNIKTISFLQFNNFSFAQNPLQEITEQEYNDYLKSVNLFYNMNDLSERDDYEMNDDSLNCEGGICPVK